MSEEQIGLNYQATVENQNNIRELKKLVEKMSEIISGMQLRITALEQGGA